MSKADALESEATARKRGRFPDDFKRDAVRLIVEEKYSFKAAAKAVGVSENSLRAWHGKFAPAPKACGDDATFDELREENKRLRKQLRRAEMEREILKKATAYFAKESQ
jgi:transposase